MRPVDDIPAVVQDAWRAVLGRPDLPADADFFELGGSSIHGVRLMGELRTTLDVPLPVQLIFFHPELADFTTAVGDAARRIGADTPAPPGPEPDAGSGATAEPLGLSLQQEQLWAADQLDPGNLAYTELLPLRLDGPLDVPRLRGCLDRLVRRHEALRTRFPAGPDGTPRQEILPAPTLPLDVVEVADEDEARQVALDRLAEPFDLATGPLVRAVLLRLTVAPQPPPTHVLLLYAHHIVADGLSLAVLCDELAASYAGRDLPEPAPSYAAHTRRQAALDLDDQLGYWRDRLSGAATVELPPDRPRQPVRSTAGRRLRVRVPGAVRDAVDALAREHGATRFMALLAAFHALLGRWAGTEDVTVGSPVSGRSGAEADRLVGYLVNMVALRGDTSGDPSFRALLTRTRELALGALANADVPFSRVAALVPGRDRSRPPVFSATIVAQPTSLALVADLGTVTAVSFPVPRQHCTYDLSLYVWDDPDELVLDVEYSTALYDEETVRGFAEQYRELLATAVRSPDLPLSALDAVPPRQRALLRAWNDTAAPFDLDTCLHRLVEAQARATPDRIAVSSGDRHVSYAELDAAAGTLAERLRAAGVGPDTVVAVRMRRCVTQLTALLAVWKAGGAYLPLDPSYPDRRVEFMLADSGAPVLLTEAAGAPDGVHLLVRGEPGVGRGHGEPGPDNLAYVMYTSGTSGQPKGVMVAHRGITNRVLWMQREYGLTADDVMLQNAAYTFDFSVWEFFGPLVLGARLVLPDPDGHRDAAHLADLVTRHGVTTVHFVPTMLRPFLAEPGLAAATGLRRVFSGGEPLPADLAAEFHDRFGGAVELHNLYGPTEASVDVTSWPVPPGLAGRIPIGRPVSNVTCHVLDARLRQLPVGVPGELCVGGVQLARGYLGRFGLTAERFVPDPFGPPGSRLYRTGDRVRRRADGAVDYLDRMDRQTKIRGFRVEPAEVEAALTAHPDVAQAAVIVREDHPGDRRLVAYCVSTTDREPSGLREFLAARLPEHMLPSAYVPLPRLPVSASGKLDRSALPAPPAERPQGAKGYQPPRGERESLLATLWSELLGVERVGRDDRFFELGGDSILGIRMIARARRAGVEVTVPQLFRHQTIAALAEVATHPAPAASPAPAATEPVRRFPLTPLQREMLRETAGAPGRGLYVVPAEALVDGDVDQDALNAAFTRLVAHHPILRTCVDGASHVVHPDAEPVFRFEDWRGIPDTEHERRRRARIEREWRDGLDPATAPLSRLSLARLGDRRHSLLWTRHNVLLDGWSFARLFDDLLQLHATLRDGAPEPVLTAPAPFAGYVDWLGPRAEPAAEALDAELLRGVRPARLFEPQAGPDAGPYREIRMSLPARVERFVHRRRLTLSTMLEAAWAIVLARHTGTADVRFGLVFSTRPAELPAVESMVGLLINTLPSALRVPARTPVLGWLDELYARAVRMQELATASLPELRRRHGPLWDTLLLLHNYPHGFDGTLPGDLRLVDTQGFSQVGAALTVSVDPQPLRLAMLFDPARAAEATVRELGTDLAAVLAAMLADPDRPVAEVLR